MNVPTRREQLIEFLKQAQALDARRAKEEMSQRGWWDEDGVRQGGLMAFIRRYWHVLEPGTPFVDGWVLGDMCDHLEAVTFGEINKLLINIFPGGMKSLLTDCFWPAWEWGPMNLPHLRYIAFSYSSHMTRRDNLKMLNLIRSPEYQKDWGDRVVLRKTGEEIVSNSKHGYKFATSIGGVGTGERGDRIILDDPHNVKEGESETVRDETVRWFREAMSNRLNDMETGAIVIIMQRVHEGDVSGAILDDEENQLGYTHLCIQMEFDWEASTGSDGQPVRNRYGWSDPRWTPSQQDSEGDLAWPERFSPQIVAEMKATMGPIGWAGQYQQTPRTRGAEIVPKDYWQLWESDDGKFPPCEFVLASLDSAFTEKEQNDPSALTVWGVFRNKNGQRRIILLNAWRKRLKLNGQMPEKRPYESVVAYRQRTMKNWGLVQWVADTCTRFRADRLLIENKANGKDVADELMRQYARSGWAIQLMDPVKDKVTRAHAVSPTWSQGMIYAPDRDWATMVIEEFESFPRGKHDDLVDSSTQAVKWLRMTGMAQTDEEALADEHESVRHRPRRKSLAAHYQGVGND